jgi:murein DD-endopeptidase MepM/ murein hydrolase activator NlpD
MKKYRPLSTWSLLCLLGLFLLPLLSNPGQNVENKDIEFELPIKKGWITSDYGWRINPFTGKKEFHKGLDIAAPKGADVFTAADGTVLSAVSDYEQNSFYGKYILIMHTDKVRTHYSKLDSVLVRKGQTVKIGEVIGKVGSTGQSRGPHLHFEILVNDESKNPTEYIDFKSKAIIKSHFIPKVDKIETRLNQRP